MQQAELTAGSSKDLAFSPGAADGVLRVTVWNAEGKPLAERLIFRQPIHSVQVQLSADARQYIPGSHARITVKTCDETGQPIRAVVGITATDDSVLEMIDKREQTPRLPAMVLLEGEVKELADAQVYLDPANEKARTAVDLLLGTQGWRRFAFIEPAKFAAANGDMARRVLALKQAAQPISAAWAICRSRRLWWWRGCENGQGARAGRFRHRRCRSNLWQLKPRRRREKRSMGLTPKRTESLENREKRSSVKLPPNLRRLRSRGICVAPVDEREIGRRRRIDEGDWDAEQSAMRNDFVPVRIYAHQVRSQRQPGDRADFAETLFWSAGIRTDEHGQATVEFGLNDAVTSFRVFGDAFSDSGAGAASLAIDSVAPFYLEPKLPLEVTADDMIRVPLGIVNVTNVPLENGSLQYQVKTASHVDSGNMRFTLGANGRMRQYVNLQVGKLNGEGQLSLAATAGPYSDKVARSLTVRPLGFPALLAFGGLLPPGGTASQDVMVPGTLVAGSLEARVVVYPTPLASMNETLAALIREPYGCFEQTSSTIYPLVMAQQYFMSHQGVDPALIEKSSLILQTGYDRLRGFESKSGGYEWFGADPGHDALSAYGLMEFTDMAQVRQVDAVMLERTRKWLLEQRDAKGGYLRKTHTLHTWIADPECATPTTLGHAGSRRQSRPGHRGEMGS